MIIRLLSLLCFSFIACNNPTNKPQEESKRFLALGDSYTIGESVEINKRWPVQLVNRLNAMNIPFDPPTIVAKTGWTTDELIAAIEITTLEEPYDYVSLLIGVNNQYRGRSVEEFRTQFIELLERAIAYANGNEKHVFVLSIPDWGVTPFAVSRDSAQIALEIDAFNQVIALECAARNISYFDITPISRRAPEQPELIAADGLHPSDQMYALWVNELIPFFNHN